MEGPPRLRRLARPWDRGTAAGAGAAAFVAVSLVSGWAWSSGAELSLAGYNLLTWHFALGTALTLVVLGHALVRQSRCDEGISRGVASS